MQKENGKGKKEIWHCHWNQLVARNIPQSWRIGLQPLPKQSSRFTRIRPISVLSAHTICLGIKHRFKTPHTKNNLFLSPQKRSLAVIFQTKGNLPSSIVFCEKGMTLITNSKIIVWLWTHSEQGQFCELSTVYQRRQFLNTSFRISYWPLALFYT